MIKIGLTGSIAMGKSEVARILAAQGLPLFDADVEVHKLYDSEDGAKLLQQHVPEAIVDSRVDRGKLTEIVMADPQRLHQLEAVVHAEIGRRRSQFVATAEADGYSIALFDIPLLFEKQLENTVDVTLVVSAPLAEQQNRALARPHMTQQKLEMILSRQMPDYEKRNRADYIIENDGSLDVLNQRTLNVLTEIKRAHSL
jgi:dephospho-CoA kinase